MKAGIIEVETVDPTDDNPVRTPLLGGDGSQLTIKQVDTALRILAAESPYFIYSPSGTSGCFYTKEAYGTEPNAGCIFGQAFQRLGVDMDTIKDVGIIALLGAQCPVEWQVVQERQDNGSAWGDAIEELQSYGSNPTIPSTMAYGKISRSDTKLFNHHTHTPLFNKTPLTQ